MAFQDSPARMSIKNMSLSPPGDVLTAQFNPTELEESLSTDWAKLAVLGFSHKPQQFQQTDNHAFQFELTFNAVDDSPTSQLPTIAAARRFLLALCYSPRSAQRSVASGGPPRVLFVWPKLASLTSVVKKVSFKHTMFNREGDSVLFVAKLQLEEIRDARLYADEVLKNGTIRGPGSSSK
jgi:hypothetical protein